MVWSGKRELAKAAHKIASEKYPEGYNKKQLIEASKEVNGGFSTTPYKKVKTREDINNLANHMANIDGHYPAGISPCFVVGINGDCGLECPVFLDGECEEIGDITQDDILSADHISEEDKGYLISVYFE